MRILLALLLYVTLAATHLHASTTTLNRDLDGDNVKVQLSSPFSDLPPGGCVPYTVNIENNFSAPGTWRLTFRSRSDLSGPGGWTFAQDLSVAPNASASFDLLVPLPAGKPESGMQLNITVSGPGFDNSSTMRRNTTYIGTPNVGGGRSPFTVIGNEVVGTIGLGPLTSWDKADGHEFYGTTADRASLPADWRAYSAVAVLVLTDNEWLALDSSQREAVCDYVAMGGRLLLYTSQNVDARIPQLQLPGVDGKPGAYGFGSIDVQTSTTFPPEAGPFAHDIVRGANIPPFDVDARFSTWGLRHLVGVIAVSSVFILSFVVLFGTLVGPVNLFVFAAGSKRIRLFWTTPLISLTASLALVAGILLTDGLGGRGKQMIAILSLPDRNQEAVIQEQVARTAVLFSTSWGNDQHYLITPISSAALGNALDPAGQRYGRTGYNNPDSTDTFSLVGNQYSGSWFRSRTISGQYLQAVRPSRSNLTVLNPQGMKAGQAPVVLSSYPETLDQVFLVDSTGKFWTCKNLDPGRKQACTEANNKDYFEHWNDACADAGGKLAPILHQASNQKGYFYATGTPSANERLNTLGEVRWDVVQGLYLGAYVNSTAPEDAP